MRRSVPALDGGGAALILIENNGHSVLRRAYGNQRLDSSVPIASASKWLAAAVVMSVVDEGKLSLDDPASKYLGALRAGAKARITLRQLMSHTSGMTTGSPCLDTAAKTLHDCAMEIAQQPLVSEPGTSFRYGGASIQVAGRIAEIATGQEWNRLFRERVAAPLQMHNTRFESGNPRLAGGAVSTPEEYSRFVIMLLQNGSYRGHRVLSPQAVEAIESDQTGDARVDLNPFAGFTEADPLVARNRYGIGGWVEHDGTCSSPGSFGFVPWLDPKNNRAGVLLAPSQLGPAFRTYIELKKLMR